MKIGSISKITDVSKHTIRWYEKIGLLKLKKSTRDENNYRNYSESDIVALNQIKSIKSYGFTLNDIKEIFGLKSYDRLSCSNLKEIYLKRLEVIEDQIKKLQSQRQRLISLHQECSGDCIKKFD